MKPFRFPCILVSLLAVSSAGLALAHQPHHAGATGSSNQSAADCDTLVLCPPLFRQALRPWIDYRQRQGHLIHVIAPASNAYGIKRQIRQIAANGKLKNLVIIGDTPHRSPDSAQATVATDYVRAEAISKYGSEPEIATDNTYCDVDRDGKPDLAIGRLSVDSPAQLRQQIDKIIRYESAPVGLWQRRINLVAGTGGFGQLSDQVIEKTSKRMITDLVPAEFHTSMTYASWSSAYCPDPREFSDTAILRLNEGCLFWVYMGHGHPRRLDYVRTPVGGFPIMLERDLPRIQCQDGLPIALMLSCYTGAFDMPRDCFAEKMFDRPDGPIAVLCGSRVATPYGMGLLSLGLIREYFDGEQATLGELFLSAKQQIVIPATLEDASRQPADDSLNSNSRKYTDKYRRTIELLGQTLSPTADKLAVERREHLHLFHLLGDPLLRVHRPHRLDVTETTISEDGKFVSVSGTSPHSGTLMVELVYSRDRVQSRPPRRPEFKSDDHSLAAYSDVYRQANRRMVSYKVIDLATAGRFETSLEIPAWAKGRCVVRGFLKCDHQHADSQNPPDGGVRQVTAHESRQRYALGATNIKIEKR